MKIEESSVNPLGQTKTNVSVILVLCSEFYVFSIVIQSYKCVKFIVSCLVDLYCVLYSSVGCISCFKFMLN